MTTGAKKVTRKKKVADPKVEVVTSFKGFDAELKCRGFQYEVGATYEHKGDVSACNSGFHACENPLDVLNYYPLLNDDARPNRLAVVQQSGALSRHDDDSKIASATITISAELSVPDFIKRAVSWVIDHCAKDADERVLAASGDSAQLAASGYSAQLAASGYSAKLAASGYSAKLAASGNYAKLAASGNYAKLAASGDYAKLAASGYSAKLAASGTNSVIASASINATAKGADGTWLSLAEFNGDNKCIGFAVGCIGRDGLEADTWYRASGGKLVKA